MADDSGRVSMCAGAQDERDERTRSLLGEAWKVPHDTYVTDGFPMLLYRLSLIPSPPPERE